MSRVSVQPTKEAEAKRQGNEAPTGDAAHLARVLPALGHARADHVLGEVAPVGLLALVPRPDRERDLPGRLRLLAVCRNNACEIRVAEGRRICSVHVKIAGTHTHTRAHTHTYKQTHAQHTRMNSHTNKHTYSSHACTHTNKQTHVEHTHTHIHTDTKAMRLPPTGVEGPPSRDRGVPAGEVGSRRRQTHRLDPVDGAQADGPREVKEGDVVVSLREAKVSDEERCRRSLIYVLMYMRLGTKSSRKRPSEFLDEVTQMREGLCPTTDFKTLGDER